VADANDRWTMQIQPPPVWRALRLPVRPAAPGRRPLRGSLTGPGAHNISAHKRGPVPYHRAALGSR
jgi:hypothetical protein